jgi:hypothetical protein
MNLRLRRTETLCRWLMQLNSWEWPKEVPDPESQDEPGYPRRNKLMRDIEHVLAWRTVRALEAEASR